MLVKAQVMTLSVLICDSFPNFSLHYAAPLPLVCHLPPSCWGAEVKRGGKEVHVRFCIAIDKACRAETWFDSSVGRQGPQAAEQLSYFLCFLLLYHNGQLCLPHGLYHVFPREHQPLVRCTLLHLISALTQDEICCDFQADGSSEGGGLWLLEQSSLKHATATSIQCVAQGHSCQMS